MQKETMVMIAGDSRRLTVEYKRIRNLYLRVETDGSLRVSSPRYADDREILRFVQEREGWILKTQAQLKKREAVNRNGIEGPIIYWLGEKKYVRYLTGRHDAMSIAGDVLTFTLRENTSEHIRKAFEAAAAQQLQAMIAERRGQWDQLICIQTGHSLPEIRTRSMISRWGVCAGSGRRITLSTRLVHYPACCTDYVLLHEYAHLLVPNHSQRFYQVIKTYMPEYREYEKLLK